MNLNPVRAASIAVLVGTLTSSCASTPQASAAPQTPAASSYQAPWARLSKPEFREFLASYAASNLAARRDETLDNYLRSQTKTFDRYIAAKEVGVGIAPLQQEAIAEIQSLSAALPTKQFLIATSIPVMAYDAQLGGFPIYEEPFDRSASMRFSNNDVRTSTSTHRYTRGMSVAADAYGFMDADVSFSKVGWVIPVTPGRAISELEYLSRSGNDRKIAVAMTYSLDSCDASSDEKNTLACKGTIRSLSAYHNFDSIRPENPPIAELVNRRQR